MQMTNKQEEEEEEVEKMKNFKVLIIGCGATGTRAASLLTKVFGKRVNLELWDKGRGIGGRMATSRMTRTSELTCDLGAQYFSFTKEHWKNYESLLEELLQKEILRPLTTKIEGMRPDEEGTRHFVSPKGSASIPKYFLSQSESNVQTSTSLHTVSYSSTSGTNITACGSHDDEEVKCVADALVITTPVPQILNLKGDISAILEPHQKKLEAVQYSSRYVLGLFYKNLTHLDDIDWSAKYFYDDPVIRYISMDTIKREAEPSHGLSMVVHTSVPFTLEHLDETFEEVEPLVREHLKLVLPTLPEIQERKFMRWRYSQVHKPYDGVPGCLVIGTQPLVILAGDAFVHSNLIGCLQSADTVAECVKKHFE